MKKGSFKALLLRELILNGKHVLSCFAIFVLTAILSILFQLSMHTGNLALLPDNTKKDFADMIYALNLVTLSFTLLIPCGIDKGAELDVKPAWHSYCLACPVSSVRFAAAKYVFMTILLAVSLVLVAGYILILRNFPDCQIDKNFVAHAVTLFVCMIIYGIIVQILTLLLKSNDKAGLLISGIGLIVVIVNIYNMAPTADTEPFITEQFTHICNQVLPFSPLILLTTYITGFVLTALLLNRRE